MVDFFLFHLRFQRVSVCLKHMVRLQCLLILINIRIIFSYIVNAILIFFRRVYATLVLTTNCVAIEAKYTTSLS